MAVRISGKATVSTSSRDTRSIATRGAFAGISMPYQRRMSSPGMPPSAKVCMFGNSGSRAVPVTAIGLTLPERKTGVIDAIEPKYMFTWPPITAAIASPPPL